MSDPLLGLTMLGLIVVAIMMGFPTAFTLMGLGMGFDFLAFWDPSHHWFENKVFDLMVQRTYGVMTNDTLLSVPLFVFMGYIMERAALVDRMFHSVQLAFRRVPASLAVTTLLVCAFWGIASGIVGAVVVLMGVIALRPMLNAGYDVRLASGAIAAGGTLGILIPPSVMLIVMGPVINVSVAKLYAAAFGPGFLLAGLYIVYTLTRSFLNPKLGPPVPKEERVTSFVQMAREFVVGMVPLALLIAATLGTILAGVVTPTEAAAMGSTGAILLSIAYRRLTLGGLKTAVFNTMTTSSMVLFLAVASNVFGAIFARLGSAGVITNALTGLPVPPFVTLLLVMALIFLLGWPFEWPAIIFVFIPIFYPVIEALKYDMLWFGALVAVNLQTAYLSPPVAMSAYYLKQVVPQWSLSTIYRGMADFMVIQVIALILVMMFPEISLWFPRWLFE